MFESQKWQIADSTRDVYIRRLSENLTELRTRAGISQGDLAQVIGISRQTYSSVETGKRPMAWDTFLALSFFFCNCRETQTAMHAKGIFPHEIFAGFNDNDIDFYDLLYGMSAETLGHFEDLDADAVRAIRAVVMAEVVRCNQISLGDALRMLREDSDKLYAAMDHIKNK